MIYDETLTFEKNVQSLTTEYGADVTKLSIHLAIETFKDIRHYPKSWDDEKIQSDMIQNIAKISMAAIEIDSKNGVENQTSHSENDVSRSYAENLLAYREVVGMAHAF